MKLSPGRIASVKAAPPFRDVTFDIVRGLAIFIMIGANMGPVLEMPHSFAFRVYGSIPAPIFILIAGMWVGMARLRNASNYDMKYYLQRGAFLIAVGAFVDMAAWRIIPFMTVDVLYSIGLSLPIVYLVSRFPSYVVVVLIACIFCATPMLQFVFGYIGGI